MARTSGSRTEARPGSGLIDLEGIEGGETLTEALAWFEQKGYEGQFVAKPGAGILCVSCRQTAPAGRVAFHAGHRIEGVSDPADEALVAALECPGCHAMGTGVFMFGPGASPEELEVVAGLRDERPGMGH